MRSADLESRLSHWMDQLDEGYAAAIPYTYAKHHEVLATHQDAEGAHVLSPNPPRLAVAKELMRHLRRPALFHYLARDGFERLLRHAYAKGNSEATQVVDDLDGELDLERLAHEIPGATDLLEAADEAPVIRLINALLSQAIRESASDIHLEVFEDRSVVRLRVDGMLRDIVEPQRAIHGALVSRIKVMAKLDIAEKRLPQDGRISLRVGERAMDIRVSCLPTQHGERVVLRLLDKQVVGIDIGKLGMGNSLTSALDRMIRQPHGIFLVTGPTGSGKTTTLYAGISRLDRRSLNILTVEDPVEYDLNGVGQTQINPKAGLSFASGLRSILRQDPDVVLIGEIRDLETAEIAVQASLTGHLVLSTLHTNTAVGAITRLVDMGVAPFLLSSSLIGVLSQRLVRHLCPSCARSERSTEATRLLGLTGTDGIEIYRPVGCSKCNGTGYFGRSGIFELLEVDEAVRTMIHDGKSEGELLDYLRRNSESLRCNGFAKVVQGTTSLEEVLRVTKEN